MKYLKALILFFFIPQFLYCQNIEFTAEAAPSVVRVGEQVNLVFTANEEFNSFKLPDIGEFQLLGGPSQGHSQSVSSVNGKITTTSTYQYTYFLRALKEGKFTIPAATAEIGNKVLKSNPVTIEVLKASASSSSRGSRDLGQGNADTPGEKDLFVRLILDKKDAFIGEQIMATFKVFTKVNLSGIDPNFKSPDFTGFFTDPIETPHPRNLQREAVDGDLYYTAVIRRMVIIPQKSGELVIEPFEIDVAFRREVRRRMADPFFEDFVFPDVQEVPVNLTSLPVKVNVKQLPENAPASFTGAVGNFKLNTSLNRTSTSTNDPLTLRVSVSGRGNLKLINDVSVNVPYDLERYDPVINTKMDNALSGTKTFEFLIIPKVPGNFTLPPVEFTFFDTEAEQYKTLRSETYEIAVARQEGDSLLAMLPGNVNKEDVLLLNKDIRFIKTKSANLAYINRFIATSPFYYLSYLVALAVFTIIIGFRKKFIKQNADIAGIKFRKADKYARKRLRKSEALLKQGNEAAFFEEMLGAIWGYLSHKLSLPVSSLSKDTAEQALSERGVNPDLTEQLFSIVDTCEMARYGYGSAQTDRQRLYHETVKAISSLQQKLK